MTRCKNGHFVEDGCHHWVRDGKLHRLNGPALIWHNGSQSWYYNGKRHRTDGPAYEGHAGYLAWYLHGKRHRIDGPAIIRPDDGVNPKIIEWWVHGEEIKSVADFKQRTGCTDEYIFMLSLKYGNIG